jgi:hypothetical protein
MASPLPSGNMRRLRRVPERRYRRYRVRPALSRAAHHAAPRIQWPKVLGSLDNTTYLELTHLKRPLGDRLLM